MKFYLGVPDARWLERAGVPLFLSVNAFKQKLPKAIAPWALDSGAYTELTKHGTWRATPAEYVARVREIQTVGMLDFVFVQDWPCGPPALAKTGLTVTQHQGRTVDSYLELCELAPDVPWVPVLQGSAPSDYAVHRDAYALAGVDLAAVPLVGLGSIASRQDDPVIGRVAHHLAADGIRLHGLGVKKSGIRLYGDALAAADSHAWSFDAYFSHRAGRAARGQVGPPLTACREEVKRGEHPPTCRNCMRYALHWREAVLVLIEQSVELAARDALFTVEHGEVGDGGAAINTRQGARQVAAGGGLTGARASDQSALWEGTDAP